MRGGCVVTQGEFLLYQTEDAQTRIQLRLQDGTVWMTQKTVGGIVSSQRANNKRTLAHGISGWRTVRRSNYSEIPNAYPGRRAGRGIGEFTIKVGEKNS
jgi:hypothetical protein